MLTVHHLGKSQSERIVWLCEELGLDYALKCYARDPATMLAPAEYKALHPMGAAPVIEDDRLVLAESGAILDYILAKYGEGGLTVGPDQPGFPTYLYWLHYANGNLQPNMGRNMVLARAQVPADHPMRRAMQGRLDLALKLVNERLGEAEYLAGPFTVADIMSVFSLTTMRYFMPVDLSPYPNILAYLQRIGGREGYRRAMAKGDPGMELLLR